MTNGPGVALMTALAVLLVGESAAEPPPIVTAQMTSPGVCRGSRPQYCGYLYLPVCGIWRNGTRVTYSNPCEACRGGAVHHTPGPCPDA